MEKESERNGDQCPVKSHIAITPARATRETGTPHGSQHDGKDGDLSAQEATVYYVL
jgi:hypothetical protein